MSVQVISSPAALTWAKNRNAYRLQCHTQQSEGAVCRFTATLTDDSGKLGSRVVLSVDGAETVFTRDYSEGAYSYTTLRTLAAQIAACWAVQQLFKAKADEETLTLEGRAVGRHDIALYGTDAEGVSDSHLTYTAGRGNTPGADPERLPNYHIAARVEVSVNDYNTARTFDSGLLVFEPDAEGIAEIPLDLLATLCPQPDLPAANAGQVELLTNALLKYRVSFGEWYGDGTPQMQNWQTDAWKYALCGEEAERFAALGLPDWNYREVSLVSTSAPLWVLGEDTGLSVGVSLGQKEYLYGVLAQFFERGLPETRAVSLTVEVAGVRGASRSTTQSLSLTTGNVYRLDVSPAAVGATEETVRYTVLLSCDGTTWQRTYHVRPAAFGERQYLLQNKYGLLLPFVASQHKREIVTEGESLMAAGRHYVDYTDRYESYTATTAAMSRTEAARMARCFGQQYHYVKNGESWLRIIIEPGSVAVWDDSDDLAVVEFGYRFAENQTENMVSGTTRTATAATTADFNDNILAALDRVPAEANILLQ